MKTKENKESSEDISRKAAVKKMMKYATLTALGTFMLLNPKKAQAGSEPQDPGSWQYQLLVYVFVEFKQFQMNFINPILQTLYLDFRALKKFIEFKKCGKCVLKNDFIFKLILIKGK